MINKKWGVRLSDIFFCRITVLTIEKKRENKTLENIKTEMREAITQKRIEYNNNAWTGW